MLSFILSSLFLILFNVIFFLTTGSTHSVSVWISYAFIHVAYLCLVFTPLMSKKYLATCTNIALPLFLYSAFYFVAEVVVGVIFMFIDPESYKWSLIVQLSLLVLYLIMFISTVLANNSIIKK